jgi:hypothetical protein
VPAAVVDPGALGHRGAPLGEVEAVVGDAAGAWLRFKTRRSIEKHDGIQLDPARGGRPFGFAVISLRRSGSRRLEVTLPAGTVVEILLPAGEKPPAAKGATVYCSASQSVRREYTLVHPKASDCRQVFPVSVEAGLNVNGALFRARAAPARKGLPDVTASHAVAERLGPASDPARTVAAVRRAFSRTGNTCWSLSDITVLNPAGLYAPPSLLNEGRRVLLDLLSAEREKQRAGVLAAARAACARVEACPEPDRDGRVRVPTRWTAKVSLEGPVYHALADADEVVIQIGHMPQARREERIACGWRFP